MWRAPVARGPVRGTVRVPGSKSITNRALVLACSSDGPSRVRNLLAARDSELMARGLRRLGHEVDWSGDVAAVTPQPGCDVGEVTVQCGQAGTVMRFLPAAAALARGDVMFDAYASARSRPMGPALHALRSLGLDIEASGGLPFTLHAQGRIPGGAATLDASASSQFVSGLLLSAARADAEVRIAHHSESGAQVPSLPHIEMTCRMLAAHGVSVQWDRDGAGAVWTVQPQRVAPYDWDVEPDASNALPFIAAAAVTGGEATIPGLGHSALQPLDEVVAVLEQFGCAVARTGDGLQVTGPGRLAGIDADLSAIAETAVTFAAMCAHASGVSRLRGVAHIRGHETDRVAAIITVLSAVGCGADYDAGADTLTITPGPLRAAEVDSFEDHRMATAAAILGLGVDGVDVADISVTAKTMPAFTDLWRELVSGEAR